MAGTVVRFLVRVAGAGLEFPQTEDSVGKGKNGCENNGQPKSASERQGRFSRTHEAPALSAFLDPFQFCIEHPNGFCILRYEYMDEAIELVACRGVLEIDRLLRIHKDIRITKTSELRLLDYVEACLEQGGYEAFGFFAC